MTAAARCKPHLILGLPERVWAKLIIQDCGYETPCLVWTGGVSDKGYGVTSINKRQFYVHRLVYEAVKGPMPRKAGGKRVVSDHLCRNHPCANPEHIDPVTDRINVLRGVSFAAVNAAKTQCDSGHELTEVNGQRLCIECKRERDRRYEAVRTAARTAARRAAREARPPKPKLVKQPRQLAPCGTLAARLRHVRRREPIDQACRDAHAERMRDFRATRRGEA